MHFSKYSLGDFNDLLSEPNHLEESDTFDTALDKIEDDGLAYFYVSTCADDVEDSIREEADIVSMLGTINLIEVEGDELHFYIATY